MSRRAPGKEHETRLLPQGNLFSACQQISLPELRGTRTFNSVAALQTACVHDRQRCFSSRSSSARRVGGLATLRCCAPNRFARMAGQRCFSSRSSSACHADGLPPSRAKAARSGDPGLACCKSYTAFASVRTPLCWITCAEKRSISSSCGLNCSSSKSTPASSNSAMRSATCSGVPTSPERSPRLETE